MRNVKDYDILAIGPAFSDILIQVSDSKYAYIRKWLFSNCSSWCCIKDVEKFKYIISILDIDNPSILMEAGSTILGSLSSLPKILRKRSCIYSYKGTANEQISLESFHIYQKSVVNLGLSLEYNEFNGTNKIGLILVSPNNPERLLVSLQEEQCDKKKESSLPSAEYLLVNAYEMLNPLYSNLIFSAIQSGDYKVVLGLGDKSIISGDLKAKIISCINSRNIFCVAGNFDEFQALKEFTDSNKLKQESLYKKVPNILITQGARGMTGYIGNKSVFQFAENVSNIVSTSGAGDVALGVFLSGIRSSVPLESILEKAVQYSAEILKRQSNIFREGIENVKI